MYELIRSDIPGSVGRFIRGVVWSHRRKAYAMMARFDGVGLEFQRFSFPASQKRVWNLGGREASGKMPLRRLTILGLSLEN